MPLSPEIRRYIKQEGLDEYALPNALDQNKTLPSEKLVAGIEKTSQKTVQTFFSSLTNARCLTGARHLFPWESSYFKNNPEAGDPRKAKTFRKLNKEGIDQRQMQIEHLQRTHSIDKKVILHLAEQATTHENKQSWLDFNAQLQDELGDFIDSTYPQALMLGLAKGLLSTVPQNTELIPWILAGGVLADGTAGTLGAKQHDLPNHLARMSNEFSQLLTIHYKTHSRSLATFTDFSPSEINEISQRIFTGSRMSIDELIAKTQAEAVIVGLAAAQGATAITADSVGRALLTLGVPLASGIYLYRKVKKARESAIEYTSVQKEYTQEIATVDKDIASQRGERVSIDLYHDTEIAEKRKKLVTNIRKGKRNTRVANAITPWNLSFFSAGANTLGPGDVINAASPLITAGIIISAFSPFDEAFGTELYTTLRNEELLKLEKFITAIDQADYKVARHLPLTESLIVDRKKALESMRYEPLILYQVDAGFDKRKIRLEEPIILNPGISRVKAPTGTGKSELFRMIEQVQGNLKNIRITKGLDLQKLHPKLLPDLVYHVEAIPSNTEKTLAEQLSDFIKDPDDNLLKKELVDLKDVLSYRDSNAIRINNDIRETYGKENMNRVIDLLLSNNPRQAELIKAWIERPLGEGEKSDKALACKLLTAAFRNRANRSFFKIGTLSAAADFLKRKPGAEKGSSTGQAVRWQLFQAMLKERAVLLLDEPAANLDHDITIPHDTGYPSSVKLFADYLKGYMRQFPNTVILIASNNDVLDNLILEKAHGFHSRGLVDKTIYPEQEDGELIWKAKPTLPKLYQWNNLF